MSLRITFIGAGSVVFAKNLIGDILQFPELSDCTICLMDIDPARLKVAQIMANKMIDALKVKARVIATLDQRAAVKGARYVICTIQVGGYKPGTVIDFEIPRKYGLLQTIGDTLGIGGIFRGLRTIPVLTSIARDIAEVGAPNCLLLNYTNPMAMNCTAVARSTGIPHVGLCHSVQGTSRQLASFLGLPYEDITYLVAGINHMAFFLKFDYRGQDVYPLLFKLLNNPQFKQEKVRFEMMRRTGYFVTESSEHQSEYVPYFIHHGKKVIEEFEVPIDEYLRRCDSIIDTWERTEADLLGQGGEMIINPPSSEYGSFIIHSREANIPRVIYGNVPNTGLIDNLPSGACVELPCLVDAQGIQPTHVGLLPPQLAALCQTNINVQELTVEAALTAKREHIYHAAMLDPHTAAVLPLDKIWAMCDDLIAEHQKHGLLGEFEPTIAGTGRAYAGTGDRVLAEAKLSPAKAKSNGHVNAEIVLSNPQTKSFMANLEVKCVSLKPGHENSGRAISVRVIVPAKKEIRKKIVLPKPSGSEDGFAIRLSGPASLLARDYVALKRQVLSAASEEGAPFELKLAGFPAVNGTAQIRQRKLNLRIAVDDTKIVPGLQPWEGSAIELFFANSSGSISEVFIVPQKGGKRVEILDRNLKPIKSIQARIGKHPTGRGYEVHAEIPFAAMDVPLQAKEFFMDILIHLSALGDAHSGGKTSLSGEFHSRYDSSHFARVLV